MLQTITAIERDGFNVRVLTITLDVPNKEFNTRQAIIDACTEFVSTEPGRSVYKYNCGNFNWADFDMSVPPEICEKHGFKKIRSDLGDIEVNWDEHLVDDGKLPADEDDEEDE